MMLRAGVVVILVSVFVLWPMEGFGQESVILGDLSVDMMSKYIFRGRLINDEFVLQPALKLMSGNMGGGILLTVDLSDEHGAGWDVTEWRLWGDRYGPSQQRRSPATGKRAPVYALGQGRR